MLFFIFIFRIFLEFLFLYFMFPSLFGAESTDNFLCVLFTGGLLNLEILQIKLKSQVLGSQPCIFGHRGT